MIRQNRQIFLVLAALISFSLAALAHLNPLPNLASRTTQQIMTTSAVTYVSLRTLNAFLSTAQEVEVGGAFVVQGSAQPFKILEPIDDTVERVASVIFVISGIAAVLSVAFTPIASIGLTVFGIGLLVAAFDPGNRYLPSWSLIKYGGLLGLVLPLVFVFSGLMADRMTERVWTEHDKILTDISNQIRAEDPTATVMSESNQETSGFWAAIVAERAKETYEALSGYRSAALIVINQSDELIESFFNIIAVFFFKIVVLPLVLFGVFLALARKL
ncbi:MAG: hypothetical protein AAF198_11490 [Pseudomonadota bacterium]